MLGPLAVWTSGGAPVRVPGAKVRTLLCVLLTREGDPVSAERLMEDLWGGRAPNDATGSLQAMISRLRRVLADAEPGGRDLVERGPAGYRLVAENADLDTSRAEVLLNRARTLELPSARAEALREALGLWRGQAYAEVAEEAFARATAAQWEERRLTAVEDLAETRLALGEHRILVGELGDLVDRHPRRERMRGAYMLALYRSGRQSEALESFEQLRVRLAEELGLDPGPELTALHHSLLARDPDLSPPTEASYGLVSGTNLPAPLTDGEDGGLVGRGEQISQVRALLAENRLVTLLGPGGVGKTRLAIEVARGLRADFPDGVWIVELGDLGTDPASAVDAEAVAEVLATTLGVREGFSGRLGRESDRRGSVQRLGEALAGQRTLLLLDTCEHLSAPVAELADRLLATAGQVHALATSREPLGVVEELVRPVPPLALPEDITSAEDSPAVQLFLDRAGRSGPGFSLDEGNRAAVVAVCRRLDGIPLAIELAATQVRSLSATELARRLDDRFRVLVRGRRTAPPRQRTLRAVIDWSWDLLPQDERLVLRRAAVSRGGWALEAAEHICSGSGLAAEDVWDPLTRLVDRSLVVMDAPRAGEPGDEAGPRYRLLESVAAYALERLAEAGEEEQFRCAHARYYTELAETAESGLRGQRQRQWLETLDTESANHRSALEWATAEDRPEPALRTTAALGRYWLMRGRTREAREHLTAALAAADRCIATGIQVPAPLRLRALTRLTAIGFLDRVPGAAPEQGLQELLQAYAELDDPVQEAHARLQCAQAMLGSGDVAVIEELSATALSVFRENGDRWGIAAALAVQAEVALVGGNLERARTDAETARTLFAEFGDRHGDLISAATLGTLAEIHGDHTAARQLNEEALRVAEELGLWVAVSERLASLGRLHLLDQDFDAAADLHHEALRIARERAHGSGAAFAETGLALADRRRGELDAAEQRMERLLASNTSAGYLPGVALALAELGFVAELRADADSAHALHTEGLAVARRTGDRRAVALAVEGLAGVSALTGDHRHAAERLGQAEALREAGGAPLPPAERGDVDRITAQVREVLPAEEFAAAHARGAHEPVAP